MAVRTTGVRAQRKEKTKEAIRVAALRLFATRGFEATTVDDIAAAADVSPRTFFRYFATKDDVAFTDHPERLAELRRALHERPTDEPILASVAEAIRAVADDMEENHDEIVALQQFLQKSPSLAARSLELQQEMTDLISEFVAERLGVDPVADQRPGLAGGVVLAALMAALRTWVANDARDDLPAMVDRAFDLLDDGLGLRS